MSNPAAHERLLSEYGHSVRDFVRRRSGWLLRKESEDDLVQGIFARVLERGSAFESRSPEEDRAWLLRVARTHLADRFAHWTAEKRRSDRLLRITYGIGGVSPPPDDATGPVTAADRRDRMSLIDQAMSMLLPRDRALVEWTAAGVPLDEQASRAGIAYAAAKQARHRALRRLRDAVTLLRRQA